ncbi:MAG: hypothetical protein AAGJ35_06855, partial [Myxococcota bacterium]
RKSLSSPPPSKPDPYLQTQPRVMPAPYSRPETNSYPQTQPRAMPPHTHFKQTPSSLTLNKMHKLWDSQIQSFPPPSRSIEHLAMAYELYPSHYSPVPLDTDPHLPPLLLPQNLEPLSAPNREHTVHDTIFDEHIVFAERTLEEDASPQFNLFLDPADEHTLPSFPRRNTLQSTHPSPHQPIIQKRNRNLQKWILLTGGILLLLVLYRLYEMQP